MANPYQILRVQPNATTEQIDEAYYRMRRLVYYGNGVKEEAVNLAYAILSDPERRAKFDRALHRRRHHFPAGEAAPQPLMRSAMAISGRGGRGSSSMYGKLRRFIPFL